MKYPPQYITYALVALIIFGVCFNWFAIRPAHIHSECEAYAIDSAEKINGSDDTQNFFYQQCLHQQGL